MGKKYNFKIFNFASFISGFEKKTINIRPTKIPKRNFRIAGLFIIKCLEYEVFYSPASLI